MQWVSAVVAVLPTISEPGVYYGLISGALQSGVALTLPLISCLWSPVATGEARALSARERLPGA